MTKQVAIKILMSILAISLLSYSIWSAFQIHKMKTVIDNQGRELLIQNAEWQVFVSAFAEQDRQNFINAVNQVLKDAQTQP